MSYLLEQASFLPYLMDAVGYRNPQVAFNQVTAMQAREADFTADELKNIGIEHGIQEIIELSEIYQKASTNCPIILTAIGLLQKHGLEHLIKPSSEHIKAAELMTAGKELNNKQLELYAMALLGKNYFESLPFQGSEKLSAEQVIGVSHTTGKPYATQLTGITLNEYQEFIEKLGNKEVKAMQDINALHNPAMPHMPAIRA